MNWSDGANFYLLKCVKAYGKDWKLVSSALSVITNTFLRDDNGQDFSDKNCSIQYKYLIASTRQVEGQLDFFKEDDLLHLALLTYGHRRQEQIKLAREQLMSQINSKRSDNRKLLASRFSEITPESILVYRKRLRAFNLPDVIAASLHLEPLPSNSEEDRETRRYLRYDDLAENGLRQATIDPDNGLWIPVCSEKTVRTFFDSRNSSPFADDTDENEIEFDETETMEDLSPPSSPRKIPKLELPQSTETTSTRRSSSAAVKKSLSVVTPNPNSVKNSSPLPYLNAPLFGAMEDSGGFHSSDILRPPLKRTSTIKAEHHPPLRTPVRPRNRSHTSVDIFPAPSHSTAGTHLAPRRRWRRGLLSALTTVCSHRHAHIFLHPVTDEIAPGYSNMVYAPVDLTTLRRRVEAGLAPLTATVSITLSSGNASSSSPVEENVRAAQEVVASIAKQMLRDLLLMFANARMYNNREHGVHRMAGEMCSDVLAELRPLWMLWTDDIPGLPPLPGSPTAPSGVSSMLRRRNVVTSLPVLTATANRSNPPSTLPPSLQ